ncbi:hypothetical protein ACWDSJ_28285 [Nocardia sp. NPDC003482]
MSQPTEPTGRKSPETIHVTARYLETVLDQANSVAEETSYLEVDENGALVRVGPDEATAEAAAHAEEQLTRYLREHREILGEERHWRSYYAEFDHAAALTSRPADADGPRESLRDDVSRDENGPPRGADQSRRGREDTSATRDAALPMAGQAGAGGPLSFPATAGPDHRFAFGARPAVGAASAAPAVGRAR